MQELLNSAFSGKLDAKTLELIASVANIKSFDKGDVLLEIGQTIHFIPLVLRGAVKVIREDADKGELLLYYLTGGDTCTMTTTCCTANKVSTIRVIADTNVVIAFVPKTYFDLWLSESESWRNFVLQSYAIRLDEMMSAIDNLAFANMEERILSYLKQKVILDEDRILTITHAEIAADLNSSRVVVSRILKKLETDEKIVLLRNEIRVLI